MTGSVQIYRPRFSLTGPLVTFILAAVFGTVAYLARGLAGIGTVAFLLTALGALVAAGFLVIHFTMRYELQPDRLLLRCGPFAWSIPYDAITEVRKTDLQYHPSSTGWELPGYALFAVYHPDRGYVTMCSTRALHRILLIDTGSRRYGITPSDESGFLAAIEERRT